MSLNKRSKWKIKRVIIPKRTVCAFRLILFIVLSQLILTDEKKQGYFELPGNISLFVYSYDILKR